MRYRTRRALALFLLLVWLPLYVVAAVTLAGWLGEMHALAELALYAGLGFLWALPFRSVFRGINREEPEAERKSRRARGGRAPGE